MHFKVLTSFPKLLRSLSLSTQTRNYQVTVIGAANEVGSNVSMLLRNNPNLKTLNLHDYDSAVLGFAEEISTLPLGPKVHGYNGDRGLEDAIKKSHLILMVLNNVTHEVDTVHEVARVNSSAIEKLCQAMSESNPNAFLGIATEPINIMVPYAYKISKKNSSLGIINPFKLFGLTGINEVRARNVAADFLKVKPSDIDYIGIPVIGGHSPKTVVPLFSNLTSISSFSEKVPQDTHYALTTKLRNSLPDVRRSKQGAAISPLSIAWYISDFSDKIFKALSGQLVEVQCYTTNPHFGTRFFSSPVLIGPNGIVELPKSFTMTADEKNLLDAAFAGLREDVDFADDLIRNYY